MFLVVLLLLLAVLCCCYVLLCFGNDKQLKPSTKAEVAEAAAALLDAYSDFQLLLLFSIRIRISILLSLPVRDIFQLTGVCFFWWSCCCCNSLSKSLRNRYIKSQTSAYHGARMILGNDTDDEMKRIEFVLTLFGRRDTVCLRPH